MTVGVRFVRGAMTSLNARLLAGLEGLYDCGARQDWTTGWREDDPGGSGWSIWSSSFIFANYSSWRSNAYLYDPMRENDKPKLGCSALIEERTLPGTHL